VNQEDQKLEADAGREDFFQLILEHSSDAIVVVDHNGRVKFLNPAAARLFKRSRREFLGQEFGLPLDSRQPQEVNIVRSRNDIGIAKMVVTPIEAENEILYLVNLSDITDLARMREELQSISLVDELTQVYNRRGLVVLAEEQFKIADRNKREMVVLLVDVDNLKKINDTFGHLEGDQAIIDTAAILQETFRKSDIVARIGGDEFVVLAIETSSAQAQILTARLEKNVTAHRARANRPYQLSQCRCGGPRSRIALLPERTTQPSRCPHVPRETKQAGRETLKMEREWPY